MKLSHFLLVLLVGLVSGVLGAKLATAPLAPKASESAYERVIHTGVLRCGYAIAPPRVVKDPNTGKISGLDYDIWQRIGDMLGLKVEWIEEAGWGNFIEGMRTGRYDAFCSAMFPDDSRSKFLSLSTPIMYSFARAYVKANDHRFDGDLHKINAPTVSLPVIDGDVSVTASKTKFPRARLLTLPQTATVSDMILSVTTGKADALFLDEAMFSDFDKSNPGALRLLENVPPAFTFPLYFGFNAREISLRDMVNVALRSIIDDGSMEMLGKAYSADYAIARKNYEEQP